MKINDNLFAGERIQERILLFAIIMVFLCAMGIIISLFICVILRLINRIHHRAEPPEKFELRPLNPNLLNAHDVPTIDPQDHLQPLPPRAPAPPTPEPDPNAPLLLRQQPRAIESQEEYAAAPDDPPAEPTPPRVEGEGAHSEAASTSAPAPNEPQLSVEEHTPQHSSIDQQSDDAPINQRNDRVTIFNAAHCLNTAESPGETELLQCCSIDCS